jgi:hypothetical protein
MYILAGSGNVAWLALPSDKVYILFFSAINFLTLRCTLKYEKAILRMKKI